MELLTLQRIKDAQILAVEKGRIATEKCWYFTNVHCSPASTVLIKADRTSHITLVFPLACDASRVHVHSGQKTSLYNFFCVSLLLPTRFSLPAEYFHSCHKYQKAFLYVSCLIFCLLFLS